MLAHAKTSGLSQRGCRVARFDELVDRVERKLILDDSREYTTVGVRWYGMGAFPRERLLGTNIARKQQWVIHEGDVVYNKLFAWKGAFAVAGPAVDGLIVSDKFPTYRPRPHVVDSRYLSYYFRSERLRREALELSKGAAAISKLTLNPPQFWDLTIPLPSLTEQRRIADRLEAIVGELDRARGLRNDAFAMRDALVQSVAARWFPSEVSPSAWPSLSAVVHHIESGWSPQCFSEPAEDGNWGVLKVGAVSSGKFVPRENKALPPDLQPRPDLAVRAGDFLVGRANTTGLVGACAIVGEDHPYLLLCDKILRLRFKPDAELQPRYLDYALKSRALRNQIEAAVAGTSSSMKNISQAKLLALRLPLPPLAEQQLAVAELDSVRRALHPVRELQRLTAQQIDALLPALLGHLFV